MAIVYVETNFLLEIALRQEQAYAARRILELAMTGKIHLHVPSFSISEAVNTITNRIAKIKDTEREITQKRKKILRRLKRSRTKVHRQESKRLAESVLDVARVTETELNNLKAVLRTMLRCSTTIELTRALVVASTRAERKYGLAFSDALVFASVQHDARNRRNVPKYFITRDKKDLGQPDVKNALRRRGVKVVPSFDDGLEAVQASISR